MEKNHSEFSSCLLHYEHFVNNIEVKMGQEDNLLASHDGFALVEQYSSAVGGC